MLSECFLLTLSYKDQKRVPSNAKVQGGERRFEQPLPGDLQHGGPPLLAAVEHVVQLKTDQGPNESPGLISVSAPEIGIMIPGCASPLTQYPHCFSDGHSACSLMRQYPDLRLPQEKDKAWGAHNAESYQCLSVSVSGLPLQAPRRAQSQEGSAVLEQMPPGNQGTSNSDQGYLEMNSHPGLSLLRLEPMSNSLLNGLLERHLEELYREHFTDSLARCNSQLGHSLLRGLVPLLQPDGRAPASDSPGASLEGVPSALGDLKVSYLNTTSHFSSPVLRISEVEDSP